MGSLRITEARTGISGQAQAAAPPTGLGFVMGRGRGYGLWAMGQGPEVRTDAAPLRPPRRRSSVSPAR
ncbi:hypothetical protein Sgleb_74100 [Streptomyces glebosus]|uniref:Uncharacterized protein n=1 Tax=Streptomyces glebosus TaxID=249580 RepID=A0A640T6L1_9ACTN|nr:hypothetical protein Sgleb_74100 [Streptomyces glebosus]GHG62559.1 hypothetical protein GCM10010513_29310 [Streptomyces glebosus]